jgi:hypothetical protein
MVWYGMMWYGMVLYDMAWYGMAWYGMVWYRMKTPGLGKVLALNDPSAKSIRDSLRESPLLVHAGPAPRQ